MPLYPGFNKAILGLMIALFIAVLGVAHLKTNASYLAYFDPQDPLVQQHLQQKNTFDTHDSLVLLLYSKDKTPLTNSKHFYQNSKALISQLKVLAQIKSVQDYLSQLRWRHNIFTQHKIKKIQLLSGDASLALILLDVQLADNKSALQIQALNKKVQKITRSAFSDKNIDVYLSGALGLNNAYIETVRHDIKVFIPFLILCMFTALSWVLKSVKLAVAMLSIGLLATLGSFGIIGWLGYTLASINVFTPVMIIGLSIVTNMHNSIAFLQKIASGQSRAQALRNSFKENLTPLTMSCLTTALGFLFLLNSPSPPIVVTGLSSALGIVISLLLSLTLFQLMLFATAAKQSKSAFNPLPVWLNPNINFLSRSFKKIALLTIGLLTLAIFGISQLRIDDNVYEYFPEDYDFRKSVALLDKSFNGTVNIDYRVSATNSENNNIPLAQWSDKQWQHLHSFIATLEKMPQLNSLFPGSHLLNSENIKRFYKQQNTSKSPLLAYVNTVHHNIRLQLRFDTMSARQVLALDSFIGSQWSDFSNKNSSSVRISKGTSPDILFANVSYNNAHNMFSSLLLALTLISAITGLLLRSWKLCALVFVCNFFPIILAYGLLGVSGGYLTLGSTVVIGMIIGIIVDDTLHLLFKFKKFQHSSQVKNTPFDALQKLQQRVFPAVIISSFIIILALSIGLVSDFKPTFEISFFSISVIFVALLTDIILLPTLLNTPWFSAQANSKKVHR